MLRVYCSWLATPARTPKGSNKVRVRVCQRHYGGYLTPPNFMTQSFAREDGLLGLREPSSKRKPHMAGLFAKTKEKSKETPTARKQKGSAWSVGDPNAEAIAKAVKQLVALEAEKKTVEAKMNIFKTQVKRYAEESFVRDYVALGCCPDSPMTVQNSDGEKVTFVVQDRGSQYGIKDDQKEALVDLLGENAAEDLLYEETSFGFSREVLSLPGVQEVIEKHLVNAMEELQKSNVLSEEQVGELLTVKNTVTLKPNTLQRLTSICGKDVTRVKQFLEIVGSSITRYIKV